VVTALGSSDSIGRASLAVAVSIELAVARVIDSNRVAIRAYQPTPMAPVAAMALPKQLSQNTHMEAFHPPTPRPRGVLHELGLAHPALADPAVAFSGEGARRFGGRWNAPGRPVVYVSLRLSLAALKTLAHADRRRFERDYVAFEVTMTDDVILELRDDDLPGDWRARPVNPGARVWGAGERARRVY
jgi:hypothetical protein